MHYFNRSVQGIKVSFVEITVTVDTKFKTKQIVIRCQQPPLCIPAHESLANGSILLCAHMIGNLVKGMH